MKKNEKTALIIALSLFGTGILICLLLFARAGFDLSSLSVNIRYSQKDGIDARSDIVTDHIEKSIEGKGQEIALNLISADVFISQSQDDNIHISYDNSDDIYFELQDGESALTLIQKEKSSINIGFWFNFNHNRTVNISLPSGHSGNLNISGASSNVNIANCAINGKTQIKTISGKVSLNNIDTDSIVVKGTSGDIYIDSPQTINIEVNTVSGDISVINVAETTPVELETVSGKVYAENVKTQGLKLKTISGRIKLIELSGSKADITSTSGSVFLERANFDEIVFSSISGSISGTVIGLPDDYTVFSNTKSGGNSLSSHRSRGEKTLDLKSTSGSIRISFEP